MDIICLSNTITMQLESYMCSYYSIKCDTACHKAELCCVSESETFFSFDLVTLKGNLSIQSIAFQIVQQATLKDMQHKYIYFIHCICTGIQNQYFYISIQCISLTVCFAHTPFKLIGSFELIYLN